MEENHEEMEDVGDASSDSFIDDSEDDEPSTSGQDGLFLEAGHCTCFYFLPKLKTIRHFCSHILLIFSLHSYP